MIGVDQLMMVVSDGEKQAREVKEAKEVGGTMTDGGLMTMVGMMMMDGDGMKNRMNLFVFNDSSNARRRRKREVDGDDLEATSRKEEGNWTSSSLQEYLTTPVVT